MDARSRPLEDISFGEFNEAWQGKMTGAELNAAVDKEDKFREEMVKSKGTPKETGNGRELKRGCIQDTSVELYQRVKMERKLRKAWERIQEPQRWKLKVLEEKNVKGWPRKRNADGQN